MSVDACRAIRELRRAAGTSALYPPEHPSHALAAEAVRGTLGWLFESANKLDITCARDVLSAGGEELPTDDEAISALARSWWDQGICKVRLRPRMSAQELDVLLELFNPTDGTEHRGIAERLRKMGAMKLRVKEINYGRFVARSDARALGSDQPPLDGPEIINKLAGIGKGTEGLTKEELRRALGMLHHPEALATALEAAAGFDRKEQKGKKRAKSEKAVAKRLREADAKGKAIAETIQRLAEAATEASESDRDKAFRKLAEVVRQMDPAAAAMAFRADTAGKQEADFDALGEVARHLDKDEIVEIVRRAPHEVASEASAVQRRLLERVAGDPERLEELQPALREGLTEDGMAEDVFENTMGLVMRSLRTRSGAAGGTLMATMDGVRAERRSALEDELERALGEDKWVARAMTCIELLHITQPSERYPKALAALRQALRNVRDDLRLEAAPNLALGLAEATGPGSLLPMECRLEAGGVLTELEEWGVTESIVSARDAAGPAGREQLTRALALMGPSGREALLTMLAGDGEAVAQDAPMVVSALIEAGERRTDESADDTGLGIGQGLLGVDGQHARPIIAAMASSGSKAVRRDISIMLERGEYGLRWAVVEAIGRSPKRFMEVLSLALHDPDDNIRCAAAGHLSMAGDERAGERLAARLRPFRLFDRNYNLSLAAARGLGRLRYAEATEPLADIVRQPSLLGRGRNDELRAAAAKALAQIAGEDSLKALAERRRGERCQRVRDLGQMAHDYLDAAAMTEGETNAA